MTYIDRCYKVSKGEKWLVETRVLTENPTTKKTPYVLRVAAGVDEKATANLP